MTIYSTLERQCAIVRDAANQIVRQAVPDFNCSVDEGPASRDCSGGGHSQCVTRHCEARAGSSPNYKWLGK